ncbi:MAG: glycine cleavage system protein R [Rhodocyclaceae bacterium]|nr:glycine cleavage system protein R [Rhodocyclaceae bacterium]
MADTTYLILTVIGDDRPGLVGELAGVISRHEGNWLESSMSHLAGKFAGIVKVAVAGDRADGLKGALAVLAGLKVTSESSAADAPARGRRLKLSLIGHDRIGIVREVSQVLARHAVNVEDLTTRTSSAPMSAELLFHADADLLAGADLDVRALTDELERISNDLMVDIALDEALK